MKRIAVAASAMLFVFGAAVRAQAQAAPKSESVGRDI